MLRQLRIPLLWVAAGLTAANAVFSALAGLMWPEHVPSWTTRVVSVVFLLTAVNGSAAAFGFWQASRKKRPGGDAS